MNFRLLARKGIGRQHAKWSPVATCIMYKDPIVKIDDDRINQKLTKEQRKEFVKCCPRKVFNFDELKNVVEVESADKCNLCNECYSFARTHGQEKGVHITENDTMFHFIIEGTGAIPPVEIVKRAFKILKTKINNLSSDLMESIKGNVNQMGF